MTGTAIRVDRYGNMIRCNTRLPAKTIMTARLGAGLSGHRCMVKAGRDPGIGCMTNIAGQYGLNVSSIFTGSNNIVVTGFASVGGLAMVNGAERRYPGTAAVASLTGIAGHWMRCRFKGSGSHSIVTT